MTLPSRHGRLVLRRLIAFGAPLVFVLAAGLLRVHDARGDAAVAPAASAEPAHPRSDAAGSERIRSANPHAPAKAESGPAEAPARPGASPSAAPGDGRTQPKATAPDSDERRARGVPVAAANPCLREAPAAPRPAKGRGRATKRLADDAPCPARSSTSAGSEPTRAVRAPIENSEPAHTPVGAEIENLAFQNGEVPHARAALERIKKDFAKCALLEPGPSEGTVEFRFIVRAPGKAEGVDVSHVKGVSADIVRCATSALTLRSVGAPSSEPVGVILTVRFGNT